MKLNLYIYHDFLEFREEAAQKEEDEEHQASGKTFGSSANEEDNAVLNEFDMDNYEDEDINADVMSEDSGNRMVEVRDIFIFVFTILKYF